MSNFLTPSMASSSSAATATAAAARNVGATGLWPTGRRTPAGLGNTSSRSGASSSMYSTNHTSTATAPAPTRMPVTGVALHLHVNLQELSEVPRRLQQLARQLNYVPFVNAANGSRPATGYPEMGGSGEGRGGGRGGEAGEENPERRSEGASLSDENLSEETGQETGETHENGEEQVSNTGSTRTANVRNVLPASSGVASGFTSRGPPSAPSSASSAWAGPIQQIIQTLLSTARPAAATESSADSAERVDETSGDDNAESSGVRTAVGEEATEEASTTGSRATPPASGTLTNVSPAEGSVPHSEPDPHAARAQHFFAELLHALPGVADLTRVFLGPPNGEQTIWDLLVTQLHHLVLRTLRRQPTEEDQGRLHDRLPTGTSFLVYHILRALEGALVSPSLATLQEHCALTTGLQFNIETRRVVFFICTRLQEFFLTQTPVESDAFTLREFASALRREAETSLLALTHYLHTRCLVEVGGGGGGRNGLQLLLTAWLQQLMPLSQLKAVRPELAAFWPMVQSALFSPLPGLYESLRANAGPEALEKLMKEIRATEVVGALPPLPREVGSGSDSATSESSSATKDRKAQETLNSPRKKRRGEGSATGGGWEEKGQARDAPSVSDVLTGPDVGSREGSMEDLLEDALNATYTPPKSTTPAEVSQESGKDTMHSDSSKSNTSSSVEKFNLLSPSTVEMLRRDEDIIKAETEDSQESPVSLSEGYFDAFKE